MARELTDLIKAVKDLEAMLDGGELMSFKMKVEFCLLQINEALKILSIQKITLEKDERYLFYRQLTTQIGEIQGIVEHDSRDHGEVRALSKSNEYLAIISAKPFLITQQKEWLPYYLEKDLQNNFSDKNDKSKIKKLCETINSITSDASLSGAEKTQHIDKAISTFAESKSSTFSIFKDPTKSKVKEWLTLHRQAIIEPLLNFSSTPKASQNQ